ncbi:MAG: RDD family protein [Pyrinomonadaceae bacterium]
MREVHEKRAREAALERAEAQSRGHAHAANVAPQLELLPHTDAAPPNPLVTAALRRIERAHHAARALNRSARPPGAVALAYANDGDYGAEAMPEYEITGVDACGSFEPRPFDGLPETEPIPPEKVHNLVVVPPAVTRNDTHRTKPKPRRLIVENDPALNYLDSIPTSVVRVEVVKYQHASAFAQLLGAVVDLMVVAVLCAPFAALVVLTNGNWRDLKVAVVGAAVFSVMSFLYFTISTALTGRTLGMRLLSMRVVDARTGLIPTGKQSAGRALVFLGTILTLGLASLYVLIDRDKQTAHDRLARTTVITV